jgi:hypothetical protein
MQHTKSWALGLHAGDWVEVRSLEEILATLDSQGQLDNLPFMPEMVECCGKRFRVYKRADKTCDNIGRPWSMRRIRDAVHLEGLRCHGAGHGDCQAACLLFWKEAWLKRAAESPKPIAIRSGGPLCTVEAVTSTAVVSGTAGAEDAVYRCQATEVLRFSTRLPWWDVRQYVRDVCSGNMSAGMGTGSRAERAVETVLGALQLLHSIVIGLFNSVQEKRHGVTYPLVVGKQARAPHGELNLQAGELVEVRSRDEIIATLDDRNRNRGLWFDVEMLPFCGGIYRVRSRVHQIIDEKTGKMIRMKSPCIILEGVYCRGDFHRYCPRAIYPYWREIWLRRAESLPRGGEWAAGGETSGVTTCGQDHKLG